MTESSFVLTGKQIGLPAVIHISWHRSRVASRVTWHAHVGYELLFLLEGTIAYEFSTQETVVLHGGHFLVVPPGVVHRAVNNMRSPCTIFGLVLNPPPRGDWKSTPFTAADVRHMHLALEKGSRRVQPSSSVLRWMVRRLGEEAASYAAGTPSIETGAAIRALISGVLVGAMRQVLNPPTQPKEFVSAAIAYLREHLEEPVQMSDLVRHVGFSRARLFDIFKAQTGLTPNHFLQRLRIERSQGLLSQTDKSLTEIAHASGFSSGQYFSTVFVRYIGLSPGEYRKANREPKREKRP